MESLDFPTAPSTIAHMETKSGRLKIEGDNGDFYITLAETDDCRFVQVEPVEQEDGTYSVTTLAEFVSEVEADEFSYIEAYFGGQS